MKQIVIDKDGWRDLPINQELRISKEVVNKSAFLIRDKLMRYLNDNPYRMYQYSVGGEEFIVDCKMNSFFIRQQMEAHKASEEDIEEACNIHLQLAPLFGKIMQYTRRAYGVVNPNRSVLDIKGEEILDLFGKLYTIDEVHQIVSEEWGIAISRKTLHNYYQKHLKEIENLRDKYSTDYSDLSLSRKRARLDKLAVIFYTYFNKWHKDPQITYARELRSILDQIKKEVEGEQISINIQGQINVDLTIAANRTLQEAQRRVPINNLILALIAAKRDIDPTQLMTQLTSSYYKNLTGYGEYDKNKEVVHPVDLTYNWNEIMVQHRKGDDKSLIQDAEIVESTGSGEKDKEMLRIRDKLLKLLKEDVEDNEKRNSGE